MRRRRSGEGAGQKCGAADTVSMASNFELQAGGRACAQDGEGDDEEDVRDQVETLQCAQDGVFDAQLAGRRVRRRRLGALLPRVLRRVACGKVVERQCAFSERSEAAWRGATGAGGAAEKMLKMEGTRCTSYERGPTWRRASRTAAHAPFIMLVGPDAAAGASRAGVSGDHKCRKESAKKKALVTALAESCVVVCACSTLPLCQGARRRRTAQMRVAGRGFS